MYLLYWFVKDGFEYKSHELEYTVHSFSHTKINYPFTLWNKTKSRKPVLLFFAIVGQSLHIGRRGSFSVCVSWRRGMGRSMQSTHRVATVAFWRTFHHDGKINRMAMADFWCTFHHDGKISPGLLSRTKLLLQCTLPLFNLYPYVLCRSDQVLIKAKQKHAPLYIFFTGIFWAAAEESCITPRRRRSVYLVSFKLKKCMTLMLESKWNTWK